MSKSDPKKMSDKDQYLLALRHTAEHVLHTAMQNLYPKIKKAMGPPTKDGFYFDFDPSPNSKVVYKISESDFPKIEKEMQHLIKSDLPMIQEYITLEEAEKTFMDNPYKLDWVSQIQDRGEKISIYKMGDEDLDLCSGPHVKSTGEIKAFKLLSVAGAYWHGDEKNKMLTRIYGTCFQTEKELKRYLWQLEETKKRDHRQIGKDLSLFSFSDEIGLGLPLWLPSGTILREELEKWAKETEKKWGYQRVATPHIARAKLYEISGHLPYYAEDMYSPLDIEGENYYLKPMNCPHHHAIYKSRPRSYRELPLRFTEYGQVYRFEKSGVLHGLFRVRGFCQNDAHIYVRGEETVDEFVNVLNLHKFYYDKLGIKNFKVKLGIRDPKDLRKKYHGDDKMWERAERMTREGLEKAGVSYSEDLGGAAHYGPKGDIIVESAIGKEYAIGTVQIDLYMPGRFNLSYVDKDGQEKLVAVIHRAPLGSHERFIGFLIEHFAGAFPLWLAPLQVQILPLADRNLDYALKIQSQIQEQDIRTEVDQRNETLEAKIRDATLQKVPYMIIVGDREEKDSKISVRTRKGANRPNLELTEFIEKIKLEIEDKLLNPKED